MRINFYVTSAAMALLAAAPSIAQAQVNSVIIGQTSSTPNTSVVNMTITESEVLAAQKAWGDALVAISTTYDQKGKAAAKALAEKIIDQAYGYQMGAVLFKPTLTQALQTFRTTRQGALAYFVGGVRLSLMILL